MKKNYVLSALLGIFLMACGTSEQTSEHQHEEETHQQSEMAAAYACPMECEGDKTYAEEGTCPVCEMDLEPLSE